VELDAVSAADAPILSSLWYRVAPLRPRLLARARLHRHRYRGELWYLLQDPASARVHRFTPAARLILAAMDGRRSVDDLWQLARRRLGDDAPTQDEVIELLGQLHAADLLQTDVPPDALELFERGERQAAQKRRRSWINPMAVRIPLWDPGAFLDRHVALWRVLWGRAGAVLWLALVAPAVVLLPEHWPELTNNLSDRILQADNLLLLALVFPLLKALHELGHATAARAGGGEVHDMGLMLLVLMPVPYVDASSSTVLRSRWSRARVGAAGMLVEFFIAALAFYLWLAVEPGLTRAVCFNVMIVAGISTLVFNGNPLLRYDAYYILADLIELPNLAQQSARYWGYLAERYLLRVHDAVSPAESSAERAWFAGYGIASTAYRLLVTVAIALFIGTRFFFFGVLLALWATAMMVVVPMVRAVRHLQARPSLRERRGAALAAGGVLGLLSLLAIVFAPMPFRTQAEGVLWLPEQATLRAGTAGFVRGFEAEPGTQVRAGQALLASYDPSLDAQVRLLEGRVAELEAVYGAEYVADMSRAEIAREQLEAEKLALERARERAAALTVAAPADGVFTLAVPGDMIGRYYKQGEVLGFVLGAAQPVVRVIVEQALVDAVSLSTRRIELRFADEVGRVRSARMLRQVPAGKDEAPSRALVAPGGGRIAGDPRDPQGRKTLERVFEIDLGLEQPLQRPAAYGQRVFVRFEHEPEPLARQWYDGLRRLFLTHFSV
jgi:putative peptide zinc metalloprotease protein